MKKANFRTLPDNWAPKNTMITAQKKRLKPLFVVCENDLGPVTNFDLAQLITLKTPKLGPVNNFTAYIYIHTCDIYIYAKDLIWWAYF